jgi:3-oxoacyl-[acyl-carrier-protein] synthase III
VDVGQVDAIFSWALVPDRIMPSNACAVAHHLGARSAWAATVDTACASPVTQLGLAASLIESGRAHTVLLTQSHLASRTFPLSHPASPCVGDGATALVIRASDTPGLGLCHSMTHGEHYESVIWCRDKDPGKDSPWWRAGGPHFMSSHAPRVASSLIEETVPTGVQTIRELAQRASLQLSEIDVIASIQPRAWVPQAIAEGLGLSTSIAPQTYEHVAHLGGVGAIVNLIEARRRGLLRKGANVVIYAQGAGFTRAAVRICW